MKQLILTLWFVLIFSTASWADTQTVTEEVCPLPVGCKVVMETGECIGCVVEIRMVDHVHEVVQALLEFQEQGPVVKRKPAPKRKKQEVKWTCVVGPCDFIDENGNLKS